tara:strand:- start:35 stop:1492 length:1458 start_codon:yes stop_codon:yes gene_type:complete
MDKKGQKKILLFFVLVLLFLVYKRVVVDKSALVEGQDQYDQMDRDYAEAQRTEIEQSGVKVCGPHLIDDEWFDDPYNTQRVGGNNASGWWGQFNHKNPRWSENRRRLSWWGVPRWQDRYDMAKNGKPTHDGKGIGECKCHQDNGLQLDHYHQRSTGKALLRCRPVMDPTGTDNRGRKLGKLGLTAHAEPNPSTVKTVDEIDPTTGRTGNYVTLGRGRTVPLRGALGIINAQRPRRCAWGWRGRNCRNRNARVAANKRHELGRYNAAKKKWVENFYDQQEEHWTDGTNGVGVNVLRNGETNEGADSEGKSCHCVSDDTSMKEYKGRTSAWYNSFPDYGLPRLSLRDPGTGWRDSPTSVKSLAKKWCQAGALNRLPPQSPKPLVDPRNRVAREQGDYKLGGGPGYSQIPYFNRSDNAAELSNGRPGSVCSEASKAECGADMQPAPNLEAAGRHNKRAAKAQFCEWGWDHQNFELTSDGKYFKNLGIN